MSDDLLKGTVPALRVAVSASIALSVMVLDFIWLMRDEVKFIWPRLRVSWAPRMYIFARYMGMGSQIFNVYFTIRMYLGVETTPTGCRLWFAYQALVVQFLLAFVEGMLMHRIYALFLRKRMVLFILISFAIGQTASMWISARLSFPSNKHTVTCLMVKSNPGNAFFSITTMTTNLVIFFMTFWRYLQLPFKWTQEGLGRIVFRDSGLSLGAISLMMLFMTLCSLEVIKPSMSGNITYYWFVCVLWVSVGRLIMNHEKILLSEREHAGPELTSQFETWDSTWTLEVPRLKKISPRVSNFGYEPWPATPTTLTSTARGSFAPKASELFCEPSSSAGYSSDGASSGEREVEGEGDDSSRRPDGREDADRPNPRPSNAALGPESEPDIVEVERSVPDASRRSPPNGCTSDGDASDTSLKEDHARANAHMDAGADEHGHGRRRCPSPSRSLQPEPESDFLEVKGPVPDANQPRTSSVGRTSDGDVPRADADDHGHGHEPSSSPSPYSKPQPSSPESPST